MTAKSVPIGHGSDPDSGDDQLAALHMFVDRLVRTGRFLSQQLAILSDR